MPTELTRRELYDLLWSRPTTKVAAELGISDVGLHKICEKHRVPVPGRGYWAKVSAGKPVKQTPFHEVRDPLLNHIQIQGALHALPQAVQEARLKAKAEAKKREAARAAQSPVPTDLDPILVRMLTKLEQSKPDQVGLLRLSNDNLFAIAIAPASIGRALAVLNQLALEARSRGYEFEPGNKGLSINADDEAITLFVSERTDQVAHQATEAELAALRRWEIQRERASRREDWISMMDKPAIPEWDSVPNGQFVLKIDRGSHWDGLRRKFGDSTRQRLENMIDSVLTAIATCAAAEKARLEKAERQKREMEEAARRRREAERRQTLENKRWEFLERQIKLNERARRIEAFIEDYTSRHPEEQLPASCRHLMEWARGHVELIHSVTAPDELAPVLEEHRLMDDATEIGSWITFDLESEKCRRDNPISGLGRCPSGDPTGRGSSGWCHSPL